MDPNTQTPDLQAMTGQTPMTTLSGPSLMSALQGMPGPSPGMAAGSGVLQALAGQPGANPYLQRHQQAQSQMVNQVMAVQEMQRRQEDLAMRATELRERRLERQQSTLNGMLDGMITSDDPKARAFGWMQRGELMKRQGVVVPPDVIQGLARGRLDPKDLDRAILYASSGLDDKALSTMFPTMTPQEIMYARFLGKSPDMRRKLGLLDDEDLKLRAAKLALAEAQAAEAALPPELKGKTDLVLGMRMAHLKLYGKEYSEGTTETRAGAYDAAKLEQDKKDSLKFDAQAALQAQRDAAAMERTLAQQEGMWRRAQLAADMKSQGESAKKRELALNTTETFLNQFKDMIPKLDAAGFLPKDSGVYENMRAKVKRGDITIPGMSEPNHETWRAWLELQGNLVGYARSVQNEIGPRAMAAFEQAFRVSTQPPTKAGLEQILQQMTDQVAANRQNKVIVPGTGVGTPPEPGGKGTPLAPALPPGTKMEGGQLVSESGKFIWKDGQWRPR